MNIPSQSRCSRGNRRAGFTLTELLVVVTIISILMGLLLPAVQSARGAGRRTTCINKLKQQALALANYHAQQKHFPAGARMHEVSERESIGWQVLVLPMLEQAALYDEITPLPNGGAALSGRNRIPDVFICPSATPPTDDATDLESANYVGVSGSGTSRVKWLLDERINGPVYTDGVLHWASQVDFSSISDGSSRTLLIGERSFIKIHDGWTYGGTWFDRNHSGEPTSIRIGAVKHVVWPINTLENRRAFYVHDFDASPPREVLHNEISFGSLHPGGASFACADGSVHFLNEELDLSILRDLASRNGGESNRWQE